MRIIKGLAIVSGTLFCLVLASVIYLLDATKDFRTIPLD
jgi:hypothetical protein